MSQAKDDLNAVLGAVSALSVELVKALKAGSPSADLSKFIADLQGNADLGQALLAAEGALKNIPADLHALSLLDEAELGWTALKSVSALISAIKGA